MPLLDIDTCGQGLSRTHGGPGGINEYELHGRPQPLAPIRRPKRLRLNTRRRFVIAMVTPKAGAEAGSASQPG